MEHGSLLRLFGLCSLIGGSLIAFFQIWFFLDPISFVATYFDHVGWAFITFGLIGLYLFQYRQTGSLGFFSFLLLSLGMFQWLGYKWFLTFAAPDLRRSVPELLESGLQSVIYGADVSNYFLQICFFLFAVISLFKGTLSKGASSLLLIGSAIAFNAQMSEAILYSPLVPQAFIGLAFAWLGLSLLKTVQTHTYDEIDMENTEQKVNEEVVGESECLVNPSTLEQKSSHDTTASTALQNIESIQEDEIQHSMETNSVEHKQEVRTSS